MIRRGILVLLLALIGVALAIFQHQASRLAQAQERGISEPWSVEVLESDEHHVLVELTLQAFDIEEVFHAEQEFQRISVADWPHWGEPGQPQLPMYSMLLGMPWLGTPQISIIEAERQAVEGLQVYPMPALRLDETLRLLQPVETFIHNLDEFAIDFEQPGLLAEAAEIGLLRDQPVFQLRIFPFQYNPFQQRLHVYRTLKILVEFPGTPTDVMAFKPGNASSSFVGILNSALPNYESLPRATPVARHELAQPQAANAGTRVKLSVVDSGLYRVTYDDLAAVAPVLASLDPRRLELSHRDVPVPVFFIGEADGDFGTGDSFIFYGQAIESDYTQDNIYWLYDSGEAGLRMAQRNSSPGAGAVADIFTDHRHEERDRVYWRTVPDGEGKDHWFWDELAVSDSTSDVVEYNFDLHHIAAGDAAGEVRVMLRGRTDDTHLVQVYLNGIARLSQPGLVWSGQDEILVQIPIMQSDTLEGVNHLRVENILPDNVSVSEFYVNWFELTYQRTYASHEDHLAFTAPSADSYAFDLTGFTASDIDLFDVTSPNAPVHMVNEVVESCADGYCVRFSDNASASSQYMAQRRSQLPSPLLKLDEPSNWKSPVNGATYVIITHPDFFERIQTLAAHRQSQGETVLVLKTEDVYDEFYYGLHHPLAIKSLLEYAYHNWTPKPVYVLLVGDASLDPKNNRGTSLPDLVPTYFVDIPSVGQATNDNWYARVHGDDVYPDLIIGRIPARLQTDIDAVTAKIQTYELSPPSGDWARRAILVADDFDPIFREDMEDWAGILPTSILPVKVYDYDPTTSVQAEVNAGALLLAYSGHGSLQSWGRWSGSYPIFKQSQIQGLSNGYRLPFMAVGNCYNGYFADYQVARGMAEEFVLLNNKGGIGGWASSTYGFPTSNSILLEEISHALLVDRDWVLGSAATTARIRAYTRLSYQPLDLIEAYTFLGDPAVRLNMPATLGLTGQDTPDPVNMGDLVTYELSYAVSDAPHARGLTLVNTLPQGVSFESASPAPSSVYNQSLTWDLGEVTAGNYTVTISARIASSGLAHGQVLVNETLLYDAYVGDQSIQILTTAQDSPIIGLAASNDGPHLLGESTVFSVANSTGTNIVFTWDFGDGSPTKTGRSVQHTYQEVDAHTAQVTATNGVSSQSDVTLATITDVPPSAAFVSSAPDRLGQTTSFESTSGGSNLTYRWDFGDDSLPITSQEPSIDHVYSSIGTYSAVLTITNSAGADVAVRAVEILEAVQQPQAGFTSSSPDQLGQFTQFVNTSQDGGDDPENITYSWDFGDGTGSTIQHPRHTYTRTGTFPVALTISNSTGSDTYYDTVLITDAPISGLAIEKTDPTTSGSVTYLSATVGTGTGITYHWVLGDGTADDGQHVSHAYDTLGTYMVVLTATNSLGYQVISDSVEVVDEYIEGLLLHHSSPTYLGNATAFSATTTAGTSISYWWTLGDGTTSTAKNEIHTYGALGDYDVKLRASNSWGSVTTYGTISVQDVPITGLEMRYDMPVVRGFLMTYTASISTGTHAIFFWDFGDGSTAEGADATHTFTVPGTYDVVVAAVNGTSAAEVSAPVTVWESAPSTGHKVFLPAALAQALP